MQIDNDVEFKISKNLVDYDLAIELMNSHIYKMRKKQAKEMLWFLEHNSIFTAGTSAKEIDQKIKNKNLIRYVGRGGQWTWHGPGQRVVYIMLDLKQREKDIKKYINNLEQWIILTLKFFNIDANVQKGNPGVWIKKNNTFFKIASIGVRISHWITWHGISINVNPNLKPFEEIIPCGVQNGFVTSIEKEGKNISIDQFDKKLKENFYLFF
tara:strand:+ start:53 stop:685 length:633 start_codon:yes stop_codon:yes gene_type:complete